jgi:hypothetical protein
MKGEGESIHKLVEELLRAGDGLEGRRLEVVLVMMDPRMIRGN